MKYAIALIAIVIASPAVAKPPTFKKAFVETDIRLCDYENKKTGEIFLANCGHEAPHVGPLKWTGWDDYNAKHGKR